MIIFLTLLSLCTTECRVHQADSTWCWVKPPKDSCVVNSHWLPCIVQEKCDTVVIWEATANKFLKVDCDSVRLRTYRLENCHPETTLVDSGVNGQSITPQRVDTIGVWYQAAPYIPTVEYDSVYLLVTAAELADIREMLREWRLKRCIESQLGGPDYPFGWGWEREKAVHDSCGCLYGGKK